MLIVSHDTITSLNGQETGSPSTGVPITNLTIENISGSVADSAQRIKILCGEGSCQDWNWQQPQLVGGMTTPSCVNPPPGASC